MHEVIHFSDRSRPNLKLESLERSGVLLCYDDINGGRIFGIVVYDRGSGSSQ